MIRGNVFGLAGRHSTLHPAGVVADASGPFRSAVPDLGLGPLPANPAAANTMDSASHTAPVWTEDLKVRSFDVDFTRRASLPSLCRYFMDAAWNHAEALGVGYTRLAMQNRMWVLSRLRFEIRRYPAWGASLTLRTWPRPPQLLFAMRDFEFADVGGTRLAAGSSAWLVLDATSKRPQRLDRILPACAGLDDTALDRDPEKLAGGGAGDEAFAATVRYTDVDVNRHLTSARYVGWILDAYPFQFHQEHCVRAIEINFLGETLEGDRLRVCTRQIAPGHYCHSLFKGGDEVGRARLEWAVEMGLPPAPIGVQSFPVGAQPGGLAS